MSTNEYCGRKARHLGHQLQVKPVGDGAVVSDDRPGEARSSELGGGSRNVSKSAALGIRMESMWAEAWRSRSSREGHHQHIALTDQLVLFGEAEGAGKRLGGPILQSSMQS